MTPDDDYSKLYIVTRQDLTVGQQAVQGSHAVAEFLHTFSGNSKVGEWRQSNIMVSLAVPNEIELITLGSRATHLEVLAVAFQEPDMGYQITAACFLPTAEHRKLFQRLPLLGAPEKKRTRKVWR